MTEAVSTELEPPGAGPDAPGRRIVIVRNPAAGRWKRRAFRAALAALEAGGARVTVRETQAAGDAVRLAAEAAGEADLVVAAGGDGTVNEVLNGLAGAVENGSSCPALGVIPLGTANVFAHEIGVGGDVPRAVAAILSGPIRPVRLGLADCAAAAGRAAEEAADRRVFAIMAGVGFDAQVVEAVTPGLKRRLGKGAYVLHSLLRIARFRAETFTLTVDGAEHRAASAILANGRFYAGRYVSAPEASLDRDSLEVCLFTRTGRWNALRYGAALLLDRLSRLPDLRIVTGREIFIDGPAGDPVQADGEIVGCLPARVSLLPRRIGVAVPPDASR